MPPPPHLDLGSREARAAHERPTLEKPRPGTPACARREQPGDIVTHLALALTRHVRQLRHDGLRVPASIDDLALSLTHYVRTRPAATSLDGQRPAAHDGGVAGRLLVTKAEAAEQLGVSVRTVERLVAAGRLPLLHIEGAARIRVSDIVAYVDSLAPSPPQRSGDEPENQRE